LSHAPYVRLPYACATPARFIPARATPPLRIAIYRRSRHARAVPAIDDAAAHQTAQMTPANMRCSNVMLTFEPPKLQVVQVNDAHVVVAVTPPPHAPDIYDASRSSTSDANIYAVSLAAIMLKAQQPRHINVSPASHAPQYNIAPPRASPTHGDAPAQRRRR
jgi:myo-inositol-1-phosphate synthase